MEAIDILTKVRALKGAPLSCLVVLSLVHQPVTSVFLCSMTGYTDKSIAVAMAYLRECDFAVKTSLGWRITDGCVQLRLGENAENEIQVKNRNYSDSALLTATTANGREVQEVKQQQYLTRNNSDSDKKGLIISELKTHGISSPTAETLAELKHVTVEYVRSHCEQGKRDGVSMGPVIHRIRCGDKVPAGAVVEDRERYNKGEYAFLINH